MPNSKKEFCRSRRELIAGILPLCLISDVRFESLLFGEWGLPMQEAVFEEKIRQKQCATYEEAWGNRYGPLIDTLEYFSEQLGRDKVINILKKMNESILLNDHADKSGNTFDEFKKQVKSKAKHDYRNLLSVEFIEESPDVFEYRVSHCLWARTFRGKNAGDIGYAYLCYGDFMKAVFFNPKMKLRLTKTLMQGNDCCNHRYTWRD